MIIVLLLSRIMTVHRVLVCLSFVIEFTELVILSKGYGENNKVLLLDGASNNKPAVNMTYYDEC